MFTNKCRDRLTSSVTSEQLYALHFNGAFTVETANLSLRPLETQRLASRTVSRHH
jgi:hypothetical protein